MDIQYTECGLTHLSTSGVVVVVVGVSKTTGSDVTE